MTNLSLTFGTDGVRGKAGSELTEEMVKTLGICAAPYLGSDQVVIGRDTRESSPSFEKALAQGFSEGGVEPFLLGVAPTPAVAHLAATKKIAGAMVSASHNPWWDNGIKLFTSGGHKLDDVTQQQIETNWHKNLSTNIARAESFTSLSIDSWTNSVMNSTTSEIFDGIKIVLDCANGAMSEFAPEVMRHLGAEVIVIHKSPDGKNINKNCGTTHLASLQKAVVANSAEVGFAFDGDGDRVVAVSSNGVVLDGDHLIALIAIDRFDEGRLAEDTVVITIMANLGLRRALSKRGIKTFETPVGDRYVLEALEKNNWDVGGEQSGHIVISELATTGDGLLAAVQALAATRKRGKEIGLWAQELVQKSPQVLVNLPVVKSGADLVTQASDLIEEMKEELGDKGRIVVRPSGTEPLVRIMVEAVDEVVAQQTADSIKAAISTLDNIL